MNQPVYVKDLDIPLVIDIDRMYVPALKNSQPEINNKINDVKRLKSNITEKSYNDIFNFMERKQRFLDQERDMINRRKSKIYSLIENAVDKYIREIDETQALLESLGKITNENNLAFGLQGLSKAQIKKNNIPIETPQEQFVMDQPLQKTPYKQEGGKMSQRRHKKTHKRTYKRNPNRKTR